MAAPGWRAVVPLPPLRVALEDALEVSRSDRDSGTRARVLATPGGQLRRPARLAASRCGSFLIGEASEGEFELVGRQPMTRSARARQSAEVKAWADP